MLEFIGGVEKNRMNLRYWSRQMSSELQFTAPNLIQDRGLEVGKIQFFLDCENSLIR